MPPGHVNSKDDSKKGISGNNLCKPYIDLNPNDVNGPGGPNGVRDEISSQPLKENCIREQFVNSNPRIGQRGESVTLPDFAKGQRGVSITVPPQTKGPRGKGGMRVEPIQCPFGYEYIQSTPLIDNEPKISFGRKILNFFFGPKTIY